MTIKNQYIKDLTTKYDHICLWDINWTKISWEYNPKMIYHNTMVSVDDYINLQLKIQEIGDAEIVYETKPLSNELRYIEYSKDKYNNEDAKLSDEDHNNLDKDFYKFTPIILDLSKFLKTYSEIDYTYLLSKSMPLLFKHVKIMIFSLYTICWTYIIYRSYHMIPYPFMDTLCTLLNTLSTLEEPFSGDLIIYWDY